MLTRKAILEVSDLQIVSVDVPEWGGAVYVRGLRGRERDQYEESLLDERRAKGVSYDNARAKLLVRCIVDEHGERLFRDDDADALGAKSAVVLDRLFAIASRLSGLSPGDVQELLGNSGGGAGGDFSSASRSDSG